MFMEGYVLSFRRGRHTQYNYQMIIKVENIKTKEDGAKLVGREVVWTSHSGKKIKGIIKALHGNKGKLRVVFEKGLPGQAIGDKVEII